MTAHTRVQETKLLLERLHKAKGTPYTIGLLMGIISRLANTDYDLFQDIKTRVERAEKEGKN